MADSRFWLSLQHIKNCILVGHATNIKHNLNEVMVTILTETMPRTSSLSQCLEQAAVWSIKICAFDVTTGPFDHIEARDNRKDNPFFRRKQQQSLVGPKQVGKVKKGKEHLRKRCTNKFSARNDIGIS
jgi:hypothetical protein